MIKFFRKIRYDLMKKNKPGKYLKYALGEIILVVFGILIALQINNWNEEKRNNQKEIEILQNLALNLGTDNNQIKSITELVLNRLKEIDSTVVKLENPNSIDKAKFLRSMTNLGFDNYFTCNSAIFDEAVSSGKISFIENKKLLEQIFSYYRIAKANLQDESTRKNTDEFISPQLFRTIYLNKNGLTAFGEEYAHIVLLDELDLNALKSDKDFWGLIFSKKAYSMVQIRKWKLLLEDSEKLQEHINNQLALLKGK